MDIRQRVYGEQGPLFIPDQSLLEGGKRRVQLKELQNLLLDLLDKILRPVKISPALNKPLRRITLDIENPSTSILNEESSDRNSPILTHPFNMEGKEKVKRYSYFSPNLKTSLFLISSPL